MIDPATAEPRTDLPFLRRRTARRVPPAAPAAAAAPPRVSPPRASSPAASGSGGQAESAVADFFSGHAHREHARAEPPSPPVTLPSAARPSAAPASSGSLDLSSLTGPPSTPPPARPAAPAPSSNSLDLSGSLDLSAPAAAPATAPAAPARPTAPSSSSLDLSGPEPSSPAPAPPPPAPTSAVRQRPRVAAGEQRILGVKSPTVTLTRVQSGIGELEIEAVCSADVGDLRLGALYQLASGPTSTAQYAGGNRFAPSSRRPVIVGGRDEYEHVKVDLRQAPELERLAVYAFSESRSTLTFSGTLVVTTFGGGRVELPLETLHAGRIAVLMSLYNVDGQFVLRAEMETIDGDVREAARAYGYDRITWRDDRTPID